MISSRPDSADAAPPSQVEPESEDLTRLRRLIVGPVQERLSLLEGRLHDPKSRASDISEVLPDAVTLRGPTDRRLTAALMGSVEEIVRTSVRRNREVLASALSPVVSLAVRKSVSEFFQRLLQSVNETLAVSWSWRGLKWRVEAARTGKRFAEIVLLHTLDFRVEQVFLIHSHTGLLIQHVVDETAAAKEPELVSGMLKAIQDFMLDSFGSHLEDRLEAIAFGDLSIWVENGTEALLACAVRGNAPLELRETFRAALAQVHEEMSEELVRYTGDQSEFESIRPYLEHCLVVQRKTSRSKVSAPLKFVLLGLAVVLAVVAFWLVRDWLRWSRYVEKLEAEPGIVVLSAEHNLGGFSISGFRDPVAADPVELLRTSGLDVSDVTAKWEPYFALDPAILLTRVRTALSPPSSVGVSLEGDVLIFEGSANHAWIAKMQEQIKFLPYIREVQTRRLTDLDLIELTRIEAQLESVVIAFQTGSSVLTERARNRLAGEVERIRAWFTRAETCGLPGRMIVVGHTDPTGGESLNRWLSQARANRVQYELVRLGFDPSRIAAQGVGTIQPVSGPEEGRAERNRSVTLRFETGSQP